MKHSTRLAFNVLSVIVSIAGVHGCDPGWHYRADSGTPIQEDGLRFKVVTPSGLNVRVYASAFTGSLRARVDMSGAGITASSETVMSIAVYDAKGNKLPRVDFGPQRKRCRIGGRVDAGFPPDLLVCTFGDDFKIKPLGRFGCTRNSSLDKITIVVEGLDPERPAPVRIPMTAM